MQENQLQIVMQEAQLVITHLTEQLTLLQPKAESFDEYVSKDGHYSMQELSNKIGILPDGSVCSNQKILKMLVETGCARKTFKGYELYSKGREHGLLVRSSYDPKGNEHTSILADHSAFIWIAQNMKKLYQAK